MDFSVKHKATVALLGLTKDEILLIKMMRVRQESGNTLESGHALPIKGTIIQ